MSHRFFSVVAAIVLSFSAEIAIAASIVENNIPGTLGQHRKEYTITSAPGELVYLPIPRQNFPVRVDVSVPNFLQGTFFGPYYLSFTAVDGVNGMTIYSATSSQMPSNTVSSYTMTNGTVVSFAGIGFNAVCPGFIDPTTGYSTVFYASNGGALGFQGPYSCEYPNAVVYGIAPRVPGNPRQFVFGLVDPERDQGGNLLYNSLTFYVSMWY